jgi:predicted SnoaL-like aldol condensation-catalyzing enzyme
MSLEENKAIVHRWHEGVLNQKNLSVIDELLDENYANYTANMIGLADARERFSELVQQHPDVRLVTEDTIAEGDKVVTRWSWYEKDRLIAIGMTIHRIAGGKIVEDWFCSMQMTTS